MEYHTSTELEGALSLLAKQDMSIVAGGTDLLLKEGELRLEAALASVLPRCTGHQIVLAVVWVAGGPNAGHNQVEENPVRPYTSGQVVSP